VADLLGGVEPFMAPNLVGKNILKPTDMILYYGNAGVE
jgi:hypothetical protein